MFCGLFSVSLHLAFRKMYRICIFLICIQLQVSLHAQDNNAGTKKIAGTITGNLIDGSSGKALAFASIQLKHIADSNLIFSLVVDKNGSFEFKKLPLGYYRLTIRSMGFNTTTIDSILLYKEKVEINLGDILCQYASSSLNEVIVYSEKPLIENKEGKVIFNVSESPLSNGSNASDMLKTLPLMNVNSDGTLLLRGKEPLILMDKKPINLSGQQLADLLESLPANVVEKVEIMTNPPPEYATYPGGVINIITKKGRVGIYERISVNSGTRGEAGISGNFNYRSSQLNLTSSVGVGQATSRGSSYSRRQNIYKDSINYFFTNSSFLNKNSFPNARVQLDYDFSKKSNASFVYQGNLNYFNNNSAIFTSNRDSIQNIYKASNRSNEYDGNGYSHGFSGSWQWKGKNPVEKIQVFSGYNFSKNNNDRDFYQQFLYGNFIPTGLDSTQVQITDNFVNSFYVFGNYNRPLNDTGTTFLTMGGSYTANSFHNILSTSYLRKSDSVFISNQLLSNNFYFRQSIFTARLALVFSLPRQWRIIAGAQTENTVSEFEFIKGNSANANNKYWRLLPNITLSKIFSKKLSMSWVFRETIRRPGIQELNPNIDYSDPFNIRFGNPTILPALTDNLEYNVSIVTKKISVNAHLGYNRVNNVFTSLRTLIDSGKTQTTYQNISDQEEFQGSFWTGITVTKKFRLNISGGYTYNKFGDREKLLYRYIDGGSFYATLNYTYSPDHLTVIEANNRYSSYANPQGRARSNINMSISIQRKFFEKRMVVAFAAIDPFGLHVYNGFTYGPNFNIESHSESNTQNFRVSLSYQISRTMIKSKLDAKQKQDALDKVSNKK